MRVKWVAYSRIVGGYDIQCRERCFHTHETLKYSTHLQTSEIQRKRQENWKILVSAVFKNLSEPPRFLASFHGARKWNRFGILARSDAQTVLGIEWAEWCLWRNYDHFWIKQRHLAAGNSNLTQTKTHLKSVLREWQGHSSQNGLLSWIAYKRGKGSSAERKSGGEVQRIGSSTERKLCENGESRESFTEEKFFWEKVLLRERFFSERKFHLE